MGNESCLKNKFHQLLKTDETAFDFVLENASDGVWYWGLENPGSVWLSNAFWQLLGFDLLNAHEEKMNWEDFLIAGDLAKLEERDKSFIDLILKCRHSNGEILSVRFYGKAVSGCSGGCVQVFGVCKNVHFQSVSGTKERAKNHTSQNQVSLQKVAEKMPLAVAMVEISENVFRYLNDTFIKTFGYPAGDFSCVDDWWRLAYPDAGYRKQVLHEWERKVELMDHEPGAMETVVRCKDGSDKYISWTFMLIDNEGWAFGQDVSKQKTVEKELIHSKELADTNTKKIVSVLDNMLEGCQIIDFDWKYVYINRSAEIHNQRPKEELLGNRYMDMWPGITKTKVFALIKSCMEERRYFHFENKFQYPSGQIGWFDLSIQPVDEGVFILSIDVTKKKLAEIALQRSEHDLKKVQEITHIGNWYLDLSSNEVVWSEELYRMYGFDPGLPPPPYAEHMKLFTPESWELLSASLENTRQTGNPYELELKTVRTDGTSGWMWVRGEAKRDDEGGIVGLWGAAQDISEQKKRNEELKVAKERAEQSDNLKTAFLQNMSHEIRTPLNAIRGFTSLLSDKQISDEQKESFIQIIRSSSDQLLSIVGDILTISSLETKQEHVHISAVCVNNVVVELLAVFKQQALNQNISLYAKQELSNRQSEIYTDRTKLTQVLSNLLSNALKFTHEGFIEFGYTVENDFLQFYVKDTGIGMKAEAHERVFERFQQSDMSINRKYGGTGLGLSISKGFVGLLGGQIWLESSPDEGSTFFFTIPFEQAHSDLPAGSAQKPDAKKVLVAEDEEYNYLYLEVILLGMGFEVIHTKDGRETVDMVKKHPEINLILMDIKMPILDGHEAAKIIKEEQPSLPIIAQSAYALEHEYKKYRDVFDEYLTKPVDGDELKETLNRFLQ